MSLKKKNWINYTQVITTAKISNNQIFTCATDLSVIKVYTGIHSISGATIIILHIYICSVYTMYIFI